MYKCDDNNKILVNTFTGSQLTGLEWRVLEASVAVPKAEARF
jgi:hypothetical protein